MTVGLVDDDPLVLGLLPPQLEEQGIRVLWALGPADAFRRLADEAAPEVLAVDVRMPDIDGHAFTRHVLTRNPGQIVVMLSSLGDGASLSAALAAGAVGYLVKSDPVARIAVGLKAAAAGLRSFSCDLPALRPEVSAPRIADPSPLTPRESEVLRMMALSLTNDQIARRLRISPETVKTHVSSIINKLGVSDRLGAVMWGVKVGLVGGRDE